MLRYSIELHPEVWRGPEAIGRVCRLVQYPLARDLVPGVGPALPTREQRLRPRVADHPLQLGPGVTEEVRGEPSPGEEHLRF